MILDPARALGLRRGPVPLRWSAADTARYARAVGAASLAPRLLDGTPASSLPTWAATLARSARPDFRELGLDPARVIHLSQALVLPAPLPLAGEALGESEVTAVHDLGAKGARVEVRTRILSPSGAILATTSARYLARGAGGGCGTPATAPTLDEDSTHPADAAIDLPTQPDQAEIYSQLGDANPLHLDPTAARAAGFERPILHGLCTYGLAGIGVVQALCGGDATRLTALELDFRAPVYPGETLQLAAWREGSGARLALARPGRAGGLVCSGHCSLRDSP